MSEEEHPLQPLLRQVKAIEQKVQMAGIPVTVDGTELSMKLNVIIKVLTDAGILVSEEFQRMYLEHRLTVLTALYEEATKQVSPIIVPNVRMDIPKNRKLQ